MWVGPRGTLGSEPDALESDRFGARCGHRTRCSERCPTDQGGGNQYHVPAKRLHVLTPMRLAPESLQVVSRLGCSPSVTNFIAGVIHCTHRWTAAGCNVFATVYTRCATGRNVTARAEGV